jgi:hypothetical protein
MIAQSESILGIPDPRHFPMGMARFGLNSFQENLWRIVFAPSVHTMIGGKWPDGAVEYRLRPKYRDLGDVWVLEKWISAFEDSGMTETTYNWLMADSTTGLLPSGPYPHRGVYHHVHTFEAVAPGDCNLEWLVGIIAKAKTNDPAAVKQAIDEHYAKEQRARHQLGIDKLVENRPAFGMRPTSLPGGGVHSVKSFRFDVAAKDLKRKMPRVNGARVSRQKGA